MLTRRDIASFAWYGALFSAVVGWAALRHGRSLTASRNGDAIDRDSDALDQNDQNAAMRRAVSHMVTQ